MKKGEKGGGRKGEKEGKEKKVWRKRRKREKEKKEKKKSKAEKGKIKKEESYAQPPAHSSATIRPEPSSKEKLDGHLPCFLCLSCQRCEKREACSQHGADRHFDEIQCFRFFSSRIEPKFKTFTVFACNKIINVSPKLVQYAICSQ